MRAKTMSKRIAKSSRSAREYFDGKHRSEHWYVDNQIYFITAKCRDGYHAFASEQAKAIFWERCDHYCDKLNIVPIVRSLLNNHYHAMLYVRVSADLKTFMQRLHGSVAKLVNDLLPERRANFWRNTKGNEYFDGCIRDEKQYHAAYRYTRMQARRHRIMYNFERYPHTRVDVELQVGL